MSEIPYEQFANDKKYQKYWGKPRRVRLTADLTKYDNRLVVGSEGNTVPNARAEWGIMVQYDCGA